MQDHIESGVLSPTKLRMKLLGAHNRIRKAGSNSSRTSPSKNADTEYAQNGLLMNDTDEEGDSKGCKDSSALDDAANFEAPRTDLPQDYSKDSTTMDHHGEVQTISRIVSHQFQPNSSSAIHPIRNLEEDGSNANASNFEFHQVERTPQHLLAGGPFSRSASSKWNDAEKMDRGMLRNQIEVNQKASSAARRTRDEPTVARNVQSASTRDVGTEMTPIASHEPSRTTTPLGSMTPVRSPKSSTPSTPERGASANAENFRGKSSKNEMSERELRLKTRKEIAALGIQLGKMNIASWASKEELESSSQIAETIDSDHLTREFEARAEAWEEAENSKLTARYKREEVKIQAWETQQRAKYEAEMRKAEDQAERMRAIAAEKMAENLEIMKRRVEEKHAEAEARMNQQAAKAAHRVNQISTNRTNPFII
uniref:Remorin C-terminal domain-containing protein n=1 Tax=Ananas comosus var. bracteatus TaxID=296719 RepID=A0A6V7QX94_ANACO